MYAAIDIGGTHTRIGVSSDLRSFIRAPEIFDTPEAYDDLFDLSVGRIKNYAGIQDISGVAVGLAGLLENKRMIRSPNLERWVNKKIASDLSTALQAPALIENDAALAALGEAHFGNGTNEGILAYITISTGIGGARVENGAISETTLGFEPGHQIIDLENEKTIEGIASGAALSEEYGIKPKEIDKSAWPKLSHFMAIAIYNSILHWSPRMVVLGGSMVTNEPGLYEMIIKHLNGISDSYYPVPEVRKAKLDELNGLYGGLVLLKQKL